MADPNDSKALLNQLVTFIQNDVPGFTDGQYQLNLSQKVDDSKEKAISDDSLKQSYTFAVLGDRFRLSQPAQDVYTVFPGDNACGEYSNVLPHVVLTKTKLPWSRYPTIDDPKPTPSGDLPTWLTVLLFDEDDVAAHPGLNLTPQSTTMGDLFPKQACGTSTLGDNYSYFNKATDTSELEPGQTPGANIQTIDVPLSLFWEIAPTIADLCLMAHVREVSLKEKPTMTGVSDIGEPVGQFSIVFGNRLPQASKKTSAFLVSLEGCENFLPSDENGGAPANNEFDGSKFLRLAVLKSWSFYSTGQQATFVDQMLELNERTSGNEPPDAENTNLRLTYTGTEPVVKNALNMGYVPLNTELRTGGKTVSWYRGPLVPYSITNPSLKFPIASADQALVYDPTTGMLDLSYATAWTIGRMVALQDAAFSVPFYAWKKGLAQAAVSSVEDECMHELFATVLHAAAPAGLAAVQSGTTTSKDLLHHLMQRLISS